MKGKQNALKNNIATAIEAKLKESGTLSSKKVQKAVEKSSKKLVKKLVKISMKEIREENKADGLVKEKKKTEKVKSKKGIEDIKSAQVTAVELTAAE